MYGCRDGTMLGGPRELALGSFEGPAGGLEGPAPVCLLPGGVEFSFFYTKYRPIFCALC